MKFSLQIDLTDAKKEDAEWVQAALQNFLQKAGIPSTVNPPVAFKSDNPPVVIYTDGGCDMNKGGIGAYAAVIHYPHGEVVELCDAVVETTNNRMEMTAVIRALHHVEIGVPVTIVLDSEYVVKGVTSWARNWVRNGWKNAKGDPVINKDLWQQLLDLYQVHDVKFELVKGHVGHPGNERADELCTQAMTELHKALIASD